MISFRRSSLHRRYVAPLLILVWLTGCSKWSVKTEPVHVVVGEKDHSRIRVTLVSGEKREFKDPRVFNGAVHGLWVRDGFVDQMVEIPTDSVMTVEVRKGDAAASLLLVTAILVIPLAIAAATYDPEPVRFRGCSGSSCASCPVVYSWDGSGWQLDSGTFGGAIFESLARTDLDNLDHAVSEDGVIRLKLANELRETEHVDALSVLAVDHAPGVTMVPDGTATPHALLDPRAPVEAWDYEGRSVLGELTSSDGRTWESALTPRDTSNVAELRDGVEVVFKRPPGVTEARLLVDGHNTEWAAALVYAYVQLHGDDTPAWYAAMNEDGDRARATGETFARAGFLQADLKTRDGWSHRGLFWEAGPEITKRQVMSLDLSDVDGDEIRIRLESIPSFWRIDRVAMDFGPSPEFSVTQISPRVATSASGVDVSAALRSVDGEEFVLSQGEFALLELDVPPVPEGLERSYLLQTHGWYQIDATTSGPAATDLLRRIESSPTGLAKVAVALRNEAVAIAIQAGRDEPGARVQGGAR